ncbi:MAG: hypothetical protein LBG22_08495 [Treponema sp.]|jgi:hypothetical protein|nr:hypothetical protein [Treponema sp.]
MSKPLDPAKEFDRLEKKSERLFKAWRTAYYRLLTGELKTDRRITAAHEDMESAVIAAANAYKALVKTAEAGDHR